MYEGLLVDGLDMDTTCAPAALNTSRRIYAPGNTVFLMHGCCCWTYLRVYIPGGNVNPELRRSVLQQLSCCTYTKSSDVWRVEVGIGALLAREHGFVAFDPRLPFPSLPVPSDDNMSLLYGTFPVPHAFRDMDNDMVLDVPLCLNIVCPTFVVLSCTISFNVEPLERLMTCHGVELFVGAHAVVDWSPSVGGRHLMLSPFRRVTSDTVFTLGPGHNCCYFRINKMCPPVADPMTGTMITMYLTFAPVMAEDEDVCDCSHRQLLDLSADGDTLPFEVVARNSYRGVMMTTPKLILLTLTEVTCEHDYRVSGLVTHLLSNNS